MGSQWTESPCRHLNRGWNWLVTKSLWPKSLTTVLILASALYLQSFDNEKYKSIQIPELQNNNHNPGNRNRSSNKTSLSLAGLRIDERGGIYLNPLLDSNSAYFKCYVAEDLNSADLIGYILFFNTLDESRSGSVNVGGHDDPVAVIEDLFVKPKYRGRGIATQLWRKVLKVSCSICIWGSGFSNNSAKMRCTKLQFSQLFGKMQSWALVFKVDLNHS